MPKSNRTLRVCHLAYTFYENDNRVRRYAEALAESGHDVDVIALRRAGQARSDMHGKVRIFRLQRRAVNEKSPAVYLGKLLWFLIQSGIFLAILTLRSLRKRYDVVHVHNVPDFLVFAALVPKLAGARVVLDIHDILPELYAGKFGAGRQSRVFRALLAVERLSCRFADHVIVANHLWHDKLVERTIPAGKCSTILNYPDLRLFKPREANARSEDRFLILYPGTLNHHQGLDIAIRAFALVADRMPHAELHIYGEGPARPDLVRLVQETGLGERVRIKDRVPLDDIATIMASVAVGIVPKRADGFGNEAFSTKILEFMACDVPVVVSRTQIDAHYFDDTIVKFFASGRESDLASALLDMYTDRASSAERARAARAFARRNSWQERVVDYQAVIDRLVPGCCSHISAAREDQGLRTTAVGESHSAALEI
jgi:glycosyltransferase involved in cell wall biosynthesis